jgi:signal transduction histidine kinase
MNGDPDAFFVFIYFFYGLAFFSLGLALLVEERRTALLNLIHYMPLLGWFGLLHGAHEFLEMFVLIGAIPLNFLVETLLTVNLGVSFLALLAFGLASLPPLTGKPYRIALWTALAGSLLIIQVMVAYQIYGRPPWGEMVHAAHTLTRFTVGLPGGVMTGVALLRYRQGAAREKLGDGHDLTFAALAFIAYGVVGQAFPNAGFLFPTAFVNADLFQTLFGFPVQLLRGLMALVAAATLIRFLRTAEAETSRRLARASETRRQLQTAVRELSLLYETANLLTSSHDHATIAQTVLDRIIPIIEPITAGAIFMPSVGLECPGHLATVGFPESRRPELTRLLHQYIACDCDVGNACAYWITLDGQDVSGQVQAGLTLGEQAKPLPILRLTMRLLTRQAVVGALLLECAPEGPYLSSSEAPTIIALSRQLAIAIENATLFFQLRQRESLQAELLHRATSTQEAERKRIARELHDDTGQALTALALGLRGVSRLMEKDPALGREQIDQLQTISTHALEELRHMISDLRPSHLDDLGLVAALRWYAEQIEARGDLKVRFVTSGQEGRLPLETETMLFRIAQEGLGNALKHAEASEAALRLIYSSVTVKLIVEDNGRGFHTPEVMEPGAGRAWGLIGMQERAALAGAELTIQSEPGAGTRITVSVPVNFPYLNGLPEKREREADAPH